MSYISPRPEQSDDQEIDLLTALNNLPVNMSYAIVKSGLSSFNQIAVLLTNGTVTGATSQAQTFTNGVNLSNLTSGRIPYATTNGLLTDCACLTYTAGGLMTITGATTTDGLNLVGKLNGTAKDGLADQNQTGSSFSFYTGAGSSSTTTSAAFGGAVYIKSGNGGASTKPASPQGGRGGAVTLLGGDGGTTTATSGNGSGGIGSAMILSTGAGGAVTASATATAAGGSGGVLTISTGNGAQNTSTSSGFNTSGNGGTINVNAGVGSPAFGGTGANSGGAGGPINFLSGVGGRGGFQGFNLGGTVILGGNAGNINFIGSAGGAAYWGATSATGGTGAAVSFTSGPGGNAASSSGTNTGGAAGDITFTAGLGGTGATANGANANIIFKSGSTEIARFLNSTTTTIGNFGLGVAAPSAVLHIKAGTATAGTAPIKLTAGIVTTAAVAGQIEYATGNNDNLTFCIATGPARKNIVLADGTLTSGRVPFMTTNGRLVDDADMTFATDTLTVTKLVGSTHVNTPLVLTQQIKTDTTTATDLTVACGTDKTIVLTETVWDDFPPNPIIAAKLGSTAPTLATFVSDIEQYTFDATNDYVIGSTEIPHNWKEGTEIRPHIHWATNGTNATDRGVKWQLKWTVGDGMETFSAQVTSVVDVTIPLATADRYHFISEFGTKMAGTNLKIGAVICWRLERIATAHANGGPANDPFALSVGFHGEMDTVGSRQTFIK